MRTVPAAAFAVVPAAGRVVRIASLLVAVPVAVDMVVVAVIARTMHASVLVQGQGLGCGRGSVRAIGGMSAFECTVPASTAVLGRSLFGAGAKVSCPYPRDVPHGRLFPRTRASRLLALSPTRQLPRYLWA